MVNMQSGQQLTFTHKPGAGIEVDVNGKGTIEGDDFARAFFAIWLGAQPPNPGLKAQKRQEVEEVIRVLKSHLRLEGYQAGYRRSSAEKPCPREGTQEHHVALCLVAYLIVERERLACGATWRQRQRQLILQGPQGVLPALERVRSAA
jgi:hypothetical protein